jgi:hypothetical protein
MNGWRAFVGEVGVIVLGVFLALGAQEIVEELRIRGEVDTFRRTIDREIALNLYTYEVRTRQNACIATNIDRLRGWLDGARDGAPAPALNPVAPNMLSGYRSAWDNRNATVFQHLPDDIRAKYAEFYDELANNARMMELESSVWGRFSPYAEPGPVSLQERRALRAAISNANYLSETIPANIAVTLEIVGVLGVVAAKPEGLPAEWDVSLDHCESILGK